MERILARVTIGFDSRTAVLLLVLVAMVFLYAYAKRRMQEKEQELEAQIAARMAEGIVKPVDEG